MKRFFLFILILLIVAVGAAAFLVTTEPGLKWLVARGIRMVPGTVTMASVEGRLIGPIHVQGLAYEAEGVSVNLKELFLDWNPAALISLTMEIRSLTASGLNVRLRDREKAEPSQEKKLPRIRLPLRVKMDSARFTDLSIFRPNSEDPLVITEIALTGGVGPEALLVEPLEIRGPLFWARLNGTVRPAGDYPLDLRLEWTSQPHGFSPFQGHGEFTGTLKELTMDHRLETPTEARLQATLKDLLTDVHWEASLTMEQTSAKDIRQTWPRFSLSGNIASKGSPKAFHAHGSLLGSESRFGDLSGDFRVHYSNTTWTVEKILVEIPGTKSSLHLEGAYAPSNNQTPLQINGDWKSLSWPLSTQQAPVVRSAEGTITALGALHDYEVQLDADLAGTNLPQGRWTLKGKGNLKEFALNTLEANVLDGTIKGSGSVRWVPELAWELGFTAEGMDPASAWPDWPGSLSARLTTSGTIKKAAPYVSVELHKLEGKLRDFPIHGRSSFNIERDRWFLPSLEIRSGSASLTASGSLTKDWSLEWKTNVPDLGEVIPDGKGVFTGEGTLTGPRDMPNLALSLTGKELVFGPHRVDRLATDLRLNLQEQESSHLDMVIESALLGAHPVESFGLKGHGTASAHEITMKFVGEEEAIDLALDGRYGSKKWHLMVKDAYLASINLGVWNLEGAKPLTLSSDQLQAEELCWLNNEARICLVGGWNKGVEEWIAASLSKVPLETLQQKLPPTLEPKGSLHGSARLSYGRDKVLSGEADFGIHGGSLTYIVGIEEPIEIGLGKASIKTVLRQGGMRSEFDVSLARGGEIQGSLALSPFTPFSLPPHRKALDGRLKVNITELGLVPAFFPEMANTKGALTSDITLAGTLERPRFTGTMALENGNADLPRLGVHLKEMALALSSGDKETIGIEGGVTSGPGRIDVKGTLKLARDQGFPASLRLRGDNFELMNLPEAWVLASPNLQIDLTKERVDVSGEVKIPEATIEPLDLTGTVPVSRDVVIVSEAAPEVPQTRRKLHSNVRLILGDKVKFNGFGLRGRITGTVTALEEPDRMARGQGELQVLEGKYKAYGQKLDIERGRLLFAGGPIDDPGLDVKASRRTGEITSGVYVRGTLKEPQMELFSTSNLDQTDALSYLVLGRPSQQATGAEGEVLHNAALSLGLSGGGFLAEQIGESLGVEDIEIEGGTTSDEATLFIGKYLSPKLYISYGIGLFEPVSTFRLRYKIGGKWTMQTEYGINSGADLIYTIER